MCVVCEACTILSHAVKRVRRVQAYPTGQGDQGKGVRQGGWSGQGWQGGMVTRASGNANVPVDYLVLRDYPAALCLLFWETGRSKG